MNNPVISVTNLHFARGTQTILNSVNLTVKRGECIAILGPNGAGKSTLIDLLLGRLEPKSGFIQVLGTTPGNQASKSKMGVMLQTATLPTNTLVSEFITLFRSYYPSPISYHQALTYSGLAAHQTKRFGELSGGQKQRLLFTLAVIGQPELLFLDEPSLAMDVAMRREMWSLIEALKADGKTIVLTTHYLEEAEMLADRLLVLKEGRFIADDSPSSLKQTHQMITVSFTCHDEAALLSKILEDVSYTYQVGRCQFQHPTPETILKRCFLAGLTIENLQVTANTLEETFLHLTEEQVA